MSSDRENFAIAGLLLGVLMATALVTYGYYSAVPPGTQQGPLIGNIQLRSTSVGITGFNRTDLSLNLKAVVFNPNGIGATLDSANYSVYADGRYLGSGQMARAVSLEPRSSQTFVFPISVGWESAFETAGNYVTGWGHVTWEVRGIASVSVGGIPLTAPFEFSAG